MPDAAGGEPRADAASSCSHPAEDYILDVVALCIGRELPECLPGSEAFVDGCGCGCSSIPDYPSACRIRCEEAGRCIETRVENFPDYAATARTFTEQFANALVVEGQCSTGRLFVYTSDGFTTQAHFFEAGGAFLGFSTSTDEIDSVCLGRHYWPEPVRCERATVTGVLSNRSPFRIVEGDMVHLPWAEGSP